MTGYGKMTDRNWEIYRARVEDGKTLRAVAKENNLSSERVRQIEARGRHLKEYIDSVAAAPNDTIGNLVLSTRTVNTIRNLLCGELYSVKIRDFLREHDLNKVMLERNFGKKSARDLRDAIAAVDKEAAELWFDGKEIPR
jgi:hypothetical protein